MPRKKRGHSGPKYPPKIDATAEEMAQAVLQLPAKRRSDYKDVNRLQCVACKRSVYFPETLYQDGRCGDCKKAVAE